MTFSQNLLFFFVVNSEVPPVRNHIFKAKMNIDLELKTFMLTLSAFQFHRVTQKKRKHISCISLTLFAISMTDDNLQANIAYTSFQNKRDHCLIILDIPITIMACYIVCR